MTDPQTATDAADQAFPALIGRSGYAAFEQLFESEYDRMVRVAFLIVGSNELAEEVVQDAFIRVFRRWDRIDNPAAFARVCVVNGCRDRLRRQTRWRARVPLLARAEHTPHHEAPDHAATGGGDLTASLLALPARQRAALVLRFYDDCTTDEIAEALGISPSATKSLLHRGMQTLRIEVPHV